jgi:hypothetical protein
MPVDKERTERHAAVLFVRPIGSFETLAFCVTTAPPPVCGNKPPSGRLGRVEAGAKMTATWQLRTLPPTYIVWRLIETS